MGFKIIVEFCSIQTISSFRLKMGSPRLNFSLSNVQQSVNPFVSWIVKTCRQAGDKIIIDTGLESKGWNGVGHSSVGTGYGVGDSVGTGFGRCGTLNQLKSKLKCCLTRMIKNGS